VDVLSGCAASSGKSIEKIHRNAHEINDEFVIQAEPVSIARHEYRLKQPFIDACGKPVLFFILLSGYLHEMLFA